MGLYSRLRNADVIEQPMMPRHDPKEALLIAKSGEQPIIHKTEVTKSRRELMAKLIGDRSLREGEEFTPINYDPPVEVYPPFGPYDLVD